MWRYLVGGIAALLLAGAGVLLFKGSARSPVLPAMPQALAQEDAASSDLPDTLPEASAKTREEKRFNRFDKDRDGAITRDEFLMNRHKAYARLDTNSDGKLSFEEWSVKAIQRFQTADSDKSGAMNAKEFLTTAVKRKPHVAPKCACPTPTPTSDDDN